MRTSFPLISKFQLKIFMIALLLLILPASSFAGVFVSITIAPPPLPVYSQPLCPGPGYIWTPGYWAYGDEGYYWVPGTWVMAPFIGGLWTPGYWGWGNGVYLWHPGYWGTQVGFYGGVNYGYGYGGRGYDGGYWRGRDFNYNRYVNNVDPVRVHNVYERTVVNNINITRVSYNGGHGGVTAAPTPQEQNAYRAKREDALPVQQQHVRAAASNRELYASVNRGNPVIAATPRPGAFNDHGVVPANHAAPATRPHTAQPLHGAPQTNAQPAPARTDAARNQPQRNANPGGTGTAPLITAHPNNQAPGAANAPRTPQPGYNNQQQTRPQYQAEGNARPQPNSPQQHPQNVQPQQQPRVEAPQHSQPARPEKQQAPQPQAHYNAPPQQQQHSQPAQQQHMSAPPQQQQHAQQPQHVQPAPQRHAQAAPPQQREHAQPAPQQQHMNAPPQQHVQAAPQQKHENGQPHENAQHNR